MAFSVETMPFRATQPRRRAGGPPLYRQVADDLARHIGGGALRPGDRLPAEPLLAEAYGVNRLTVREAIGGRPTTATSSTSTSSPARPSSS
jgi:hypothetical protein